LNAAIADAAGRGGAVVADTFTAFAAVVQAPALHGSPCLAGLLKANPLIAGACDVHPSQSGQRLIAEAVAASVRKANDDH
jgi:phospholipase/lecithinase/hemolysin